MQIQIRKPVPSGEQEIVGDGYYYYWVDFASVVLEMLKSGQSPELMSFIRREI